MSHKFNKLEFPDPDPDLDPDPDPDADPDPDLDPDPEVPCRAVIGCFAGILLF